VVSRLALLGYDVVAMVRDVQAASRRLPSGIALRVSDYEDASALKRALPGVDDMVLISSGANETYGPHLLFTVTPAKAGAQGLRRSVGCPPVHARGRLWVPAFAGMTKGKGGYQALVRTSSDG